MCIVRRDPCYLIRILQGKIMVGKETVKNQQPNETIQVFVELPEEIFEAYMIKLGYKP